MYLDKISASLVNTAIEIYMRVAYDDAVSRSKHAHSFPDTTSIDEVLASFVSEDSQSLKAYSLRLGSQDYPHMKMMLREAYLKDEYAFSVDRHDCFAFNRDVVGAEKWIELQGHNYELKKKIEGAWYEAGVPTMRQLREDFLGNTDFIMVKQEKGVLLVDNDSDAVAILEMMLAREGYHCIKAGNVADARKAIDEEGGNFVACLIDLLLPDGMGQDVVAAVRANEITQNLPILVMTGMQEKDVECINATEGYMRKPFSGEELTEKLDEVIKRYYDDGKLRDSDIQER